MTVDRNVLALFLSLRGNMTSQRMTSPHVLRVATVVIDSTERHVTAGARLHGCLFVRAGGITHYYTLRSICRRFRHRHQQQRFSRCCQENTDKPSQVAVDQ